MADPQVAFHFNADDKLAYGARLVRKGYLRGARMLVWGDPRQLEQLSHILWTQTPGDFVGHACPTDPAAVQTHSKVRLVAQLPEQAPEATMLVNLTDAFPGDAIDGYERVFEIVTAAPEDRQGGRQRWMAYRQAGIEPDRHDLGGSSA
ncbi:DNA polymerase III subunit chi [Hydrogenophaga sp. 5NK40-0174]|uniref:DNA polymerase III subunit chi n=1 Tax=Hydrogenophaga sp. 5NK40-0174 TaxID=3127649 RepID=UPI00310346C4